MCNPGLKGTICPLIQKSSELCLVEDEGVFAFQFLLKHGFSRSSGDSDDRGWGLVSCFPYLWPQQSVLEGFHDFVGCFPAFCLLLFRLPPSRHLTVLPFFDFSVNLLPKALVCLHV